MPTYLNIHTFFNTNIFRYLHNYALGFFISYFLVFKILFYRILDLRREENDYIYLATKDYA